jgi:hypothetical protein
MRRTLEILHRRPSGAAIPPDFWATVKAVGSASRPTEMGRMAQRGKGGKEGAAGSQKHGAVCTDRLANRRIASVSGFFIGAINLQPITCEFYPPIDMHVLKSSAHLIGQKLHSGV